MSEVLAAYRATPKGRAARLETQRKYQESTKGQRTRRRYARTDKAKVQRREYAHTEKGKQVMRRSREKYRKRIRQTKLGRLKMQAEKAAYDAVQRGDLPAPTDCQCTYCERRAEQNHHYLGYAPEHWLDVEPVCHLCHQKLSHPTQQEQL